MALEKTVKEDKIEVIDAGDWKVIQVRTATVISEDGNELNRSFHRHVVSPIDDWSNESAEVQAMCNTFHTAEAIAACEAAQQAAVPGEDE